MNHKVLQTLEYNKVINNLVTFAYTESGKKRCEDLKPSYELPKIEQMQLETSDSLSRILRHGILDLSGVHDLHAAMKRLQIGGVLNQIELLHFLSLLDVVRRAQSYDRNERNEATEDSLSELFQTLHSLPELSNEISRCIISENEIADDASPKLKSIRRQMKTVNDKIHSQMNALIISAGSEGILQDNFITMRDGRYCLSVKSDAKQKLPGMVHDQSSKGSTFFIEPMAVVKLNNELTELELAEAREIEVILANLSNMAASHLDELRDNFKNITKLDFIFARGMLAKVHNASRPVFNTKGYINLRKARHPLLDEKKVVPIDVHLGDDFDLLIVTGPNTGGKTVSLKTVGLLTLMGQAGLHIPAGDRSELSLFEEVYADIGDEQSIEQNLSTFSSHMTNIVNIENTANEHSLVLFDELCAGTDPTEGAALATAILNDLMHRGVKLMATTHYAELKIYALSTPRVENACCEFSVETLSPTYRLLVGVPGKSNAFAISSKIGLPNYIIDDAKKRIDSESEAFEDILSDLEKKRIELEESRESARRYELEAKAMKDDMSIKHDDIEARKKKMLEDASSEAKRILQDAKNLADQTIKDFTKYANESPTIKEMEEKRARLRDEMKKSDKNLSIHVEETKEILDPKKLHVGDEVLVHSLNLKGYVHSLPDSKGNLFVQMGILRSQINIKDISLITEAKKTNTKKAVIHTNGLNHSSTLHSEINLIGKTVDEAISELDKYLDDAYLAHLESVRIVHGKGTGALRNAVSDYLKKCKYVKSYRPGVFGEGDAGVTIAEFK